MISQTVFKIIRSNENEEIAQVIASKTDEWK